MGMVLVFSQMCIYPYLAYTLNCLCKVSVAISNKMENKTFKKIIVRGQESIFIDDY